MMRAESQLPDPRAMAEIRGGLLEDESSEAEAVRRLSCFSISLQLNTAMFSHIAGSRTKYGKTAALMPSADAVPVDQNDEEMSTNEYEMTYNRCE